MRQEIDVIPPVEGPGKCRQECGRNKVTSLSDEEKTNPLVRHRDQETTERDTFDEIARV